MKRGDKYIAFASFALVCAAICATAFRALFFARPDAAYVVKISVDGEVVETLPLAGETREAKINSGVSGGFNTISVSREGVFCVSADCPDKLCVKRGRITTPGQAIVCLPNRAVVKIESSPGRGVGK